MKLYATQSNGYGGAGMQLASTTTDSSGNFNFGSTATACPSGQQAYITAAGGNTGASTANSNSLLLAALGDCSTISQNTRIFISEISTVAAGYALSNFIAISGTGASTTVSISAPTTNNATLANAKCTGTGAALTCNAAGLAHAFQNALNLVDTVQQSPANPTGVAYATTPSNANGIAPALLINTLGNILQSCVNSTGGTTSDTNCGKLFANATPPTTSAATPVTPTNTLQAVVNLAKYPSMSPSQVTGLFALQPAQIFYTPQLAAAPNDYSMAVIYKGPTGSANFVYGFFSTTDVADNIYTVAETGNGTGTVVVNEMGSNGGSGSVFGANLSTAQCTAGSPCVAATDAANHLWLANTNSTNLNVYEMSTTDGSLVSTLALPAGTAPNSAAVDKFNTVYVTSANATANNLYFKTTAASAFSALAANGTAVTEAQASPEYITVDAAGSLWNTNYNTSNTTITYVQNTGGTSAETFSVNPVQAQLSTTVNSPYAIMLDGGGNAWVNTLTTLFKVAPAATAATSTTLISGIGGNSSTTPVNATSARFSALDGDGNIFLPDNTNNRLFQYFPATGSFIYLSPCAGSSGTCLTATTGPRPISAPRNVVTDSTGSIWITNPIAAGTMNANIANGNVTQIIGTGAPTWAQMSYGKPGVRP